ncbi:MAG: hypothetical protein ILP19_10035 [Oscillospiraceae bacterium]|nr:hypothetical protein [Oscillospiraceae bacterium]
MAKLKASAGFYTPMKGFVIPKGMKVVEDSKGRIVYDSNGKPKIVPEDKPKSNTNKT